ncbi:MAG: META domain-containing protein [Burkholderiaceae bacterium]|nr:META domain-containing protein [Burkholderiaceae bacterium]
MFKKALIASVLVMSIAMTGCSEDKTENKTVKVNPAGEVVKKLEGTSWELVMDGNSKSECEELPPLLEFLSKNRIAGNLGCNLINGNYKLDGKAFTFESPAMTKRLCAPKTMELEARLTKMVADTRYLTTMKGELMIWNERGELLARYRPEKAGGCQ